MNPVHWAFDKLYPPIRYFYEKVQGHNWFDEIEPQLWMGGAPTFDRDYDFLIDHGINAVIDLRAEREDDVLLYDKNGIDYLRLKVLDVMVPPEEMLEEGVEFIHRHIEAGDKVLVHCAKGRGRSAALTAAYLMRYDGLTFEEADSLLSSKRPLTQLQGRHEKVLKAWMADHREKASTP